MNTQKATVQRNWSTRRGEKARRMALIADWLKGPVLRQERARRCPASAHRSRG